MVTESAELTYADQFTASVSEQMSKSTQVSAGQSSQSCTFIHVNKSKIGHRSQTRTTCCSEGCFPPELIHRLSRDMIRLSSISRRHAGRWKQNSQVFPQENIYTLLGLVQKQSWKLNTSSGLQGVSFWHPHCFSCWFSGFFNLIYF